MADGVDLRQDSPACPTNGLSAGAVPSSFKRSTLPPCSIVFCARSGSCRSPTVEYSLPSRPNTMRPPKFVGELLQFSATKISWTSFSALPSSRARASAVVARCPRRLSHTSNRGSRSARSSGCGSTSSKPPSNVMRTSGAPVMGFGSSAPLRNTRRRPGALRDQQVAVRQPREAPRIREPVGDLFYADLELGRLVDLRERRQRRRRARILCERGLGGDECRSGNADRFLHVVSPVVVMRRQG